MKNARVLKNKTLYFFHFPFQT